MIRNPREIVEDTFTRWIRFAYATEHTAGLFVEWYYVILSRLSSSTLTRVREARQLEPAVASLGQPR
jgi:hypothetical protein